VLLGVSGFTFAFALNALTFLGPVLSMAYLYARGLAGRAPRERGAVIAPATGLLAYMRQQPWIAAALVGVVATSAVMEIIRTTAPALVTTRLGRPSEETGFIFAAGSIGMISGILLSVPLGRAGLARTTAAVGLLMQFAGLFTLGLARDFLVAAPGVALVGCGFSFCFPVLTSALQSEVPDAVRGRLMSIHQLAHLGNRPFAALAAGAVTAALGAGAACFAGMLLSPIGLIAVRSAWRALDRRTDVVSGAAEEGVAG